MLQLAGGGLLGIGIWMKVDETIVNYLKVVNVDQSDPLIEHASTLFIVVGAYVFIVGFLGCCGALRKNQAMLFLVRSSNSNTNILFDHESIFQQNLTTSELKCTSH